MNLNITLKSSEREEATKKTLERLIDTYDLSKWIKCNEIVIQNGGRGSAFPYITLSAWGDNERSLLAQFLHEQLHWIETGKEDEMESAIQELKEVYLDVPIERPEGGGSEVSTYKHLLICRLEYLALCEVLGEEEAEKIVSENDNYTWIRRTILSDGERIDAVIKKYFPEVL